MVRPAMAGGESPGPERTKEQIRARFGRAHEVYLLIVDWDMDEALALADTEAECPAGVSDPLAFLGAIEPLGLTEAEVGEARQLTESLLAEHSPEWLWENRRRLKHELVWVLRG